MWFWLGYYLSEQKKDLLWYSRLHTSLDFWRSLIWWDSWFVVPWSINLLIVGRQSTILSHKTIIDKEQNNERWEDSNKLSWELIKKVNIFHVELNEKRSKIKIKQLSIAWSSFSTNSRRRHMSYILICIFIFSYFQVYLSFN